MRRRVPGYLRCRRRIICAAACRVTCGAAAGLYAPPRAGLPAVPPVPPPDYMRRRAPGYLRCRRCRRRIICAAARRVTCGAAGAAAHSHRNRVHGCWRGGRVDLCPASRHGSTVHLVALVVWRLELRHVMGSTPTLRCSFGERVRSGQPLRRQERQRPCRTAGSGRRRRHACLASSS